MWTAGHLESPALYFSQPLYILPKPPEKPVNEQALTEVQRFRADFDGVIAGAPANYMTHPEAAAV